MSSVDIAICTWNRSEVLQGTLTALLNILNSTRYGQVIVIDNNSTDGTRQAVQSFERSQGVRYVFEGQQGIAHARNRAVAEAKADWLIMLDDDMTPSPAWLPAYLEAIRRYPEAGFAGGPIELSTGRQGPGWFTAHFDHLAPYWGHLDYGADIRPLLSHENLYGNMAFRVATVREYGFDTTIGRKGTDRLTGEEMDCFARMRRDGRIGVWVGGAWVRHLVPRRDLTLRYLGRQAYNGGRTAAMLDARPGGPPPPDPLRQAAGDSRQAIVRFARGRTPFPRLVIDLAHAAGYLAQRLRAARQTGGT